MKNNERVMRKRKIGEPSSKYGYNPDKFEQDIRESVKRTEQLYADFVEWMQSKNVTPDDFRFLWHRYHSDFIARR